MKWCRKRMKNRMLCLLSAAVFMSGCGSVKAPEPEAEPLEVADESLIVVGVSQLGSESVWRTANSASIQRVLTKENGFFLNFKNARQKQENQIKAIRSFISQQVDYIIFSPVTEEGWDTVLLEAKEAGIPVILMDRMVKVEDESLYTAWVGSDFEEEGEKAGQWLADHLEKEARQEEEIHIVVLRGTEGSSSTIGRTEGFSRIAAAQENWKILEEGDGEFTTAKGKEVMENFLEKYEDIDVVVSQNDDMTFGALEAIEEAGKTVGTDGEIIMISFDAVKAALEMVEEGIINVDIECNPEQGEYIEEVIRKIEQGEEPDKLNYVSENVFTRENVSDFIDERIY